MRAAARVPCDAKAASLPSCAQALQAEAPGALPAALPWDFPKHDLLGLEARSPAQPLRGRQLDCPAALPAPARHHVGAAAEALNGGGGCPTATQGGDAAAVEENERLKREVAAERAAKGAQAGGRPWWGEAPKGAPF